jgi:hypothetical protein
MNTIEKNIITWALQMFVRYEPEWAAKITNATEKKLLDDAVIAVKALIPVIGLL